MSHLAIARKYRPQTFAEVVGQEHVTQTLQNAVRTGRLHHAYLLTGVRGVGKTTIARILAKAMNCESVKDGEPCNVCDVCQEISQGRSISVQEIDGASNTGVDDVREIRESAKYLPPSGKYKIYTIDEVHMLSTSAFNALLKTLEEPPAHVIFIFATTDVHKLPATILSRCQRYDLRRVGLTHIRSLLQEIAKQENVTIEDEAMAVIAKEADGSIRDAESLLDQAIAFSGSTVRYDDLRALLGFLDRTKLMELVAAIVNKDADAVLRSIGDLFEGGENLSRLSQEILRHFHALYLLASSPDATLPDFTPPERESLVPLAKQHPVDQYWQWVTILYRGVEDVLRSRFPRMVLETTLMYMTQVRAVQSVDELLKKAEALLQRTPTTGGDGGGVPRNLPPTPSRDRPATPPLRAEMPQSVSEKHVVASTPPPGDWNNFVAWVSQQRPTVGAMLQHGKNSVMHPDHVAVEFAGVHADMIEDKERVDVLEEMMGRYFKKPLRFVVKRAQHEETDKRQERDDAQKRRRELMEEAVSHDLVKQATQLFNASIEDVKLERIKS